jgi:hypothetical protein
MRGGSDTHTPRPAGFVLAWGFSFWGRHRTVCSAETAPWFLLHRRRVVGARAGCCCCRLPVCHGLAQAAGKAPTATKSHVVIPRTEYYVRDASETPFSFSPCAHFGSGSDKKNTARSATLTRSDRDQIKDHILTQLFG